MNLNSTVAAIATSQGIGSISVIRVSGCDAFNIVDTVFKAVNNKKLSEMKGYTAVLGHIFDGDKIVDKVVALVFKAPHSYTGENVVEISCHGGIFITREILRIIINNGAVLAEAGEFTKRAFLNGKMDLIEAESVINIINANNNAAVAAANTCLNGVLSQKINSVKNKLIKCAADLSVWADFPDEDMADVEHFDLKNYLNDCIDCLEALIANYDSGKVLKEGIETVIVGKPNVGKSTIMNLLSGAEKSIVTDIPGTTRDVIEEIITIGDIVLRISDTAGIRTTDDKIEQIGVEKALDKISSSELILAVFDNSKPLDDDDIKLINQIKGKNAIAIINKDDLNSSVDIDFINNNIDYVISISAKNGDGLDRLKLSLEKMFDTHKFNPYSGVLASERQRMAVVECLKLLKNAKSGLESGITYDAVTVDIENAIEFILELTGEKSSDVILDNVFSRFCVGK